jgi:hypothetical protein
MNQSNDRRHVVLVAVQQALLGEVSSRLRCVAVTWGEVSIHLDCYFDGQVDEGDQDSMSCVETEAMAVFPSTHQISHAVHRLDYPNPIPKETTWAFFRKEPLR